MKVKTPNVELIRMLPQGLRRFMDKDLGSRQDTQLRGVVTLQIYMFKECDTFSSDQLRNRHMAPGFKLRKDN